MAFIVLSPSGAEVAIVGSNGRSWSHMSLTRQKEIAHAFSLRFELNDAHAIQSALLSGWT